MKYNKKGRYHYILWNKKAQTIKTILYFALSLSIYLIGWHVTNTKANLLTIIAVLGCLPASKSMVNTIMFWKAQGCSESDMYRIEKAVGNLCGYYDLFFTGYHHNFPISHLIVTKNSILAYSPSNKIKEQEFCEHMRELLKREGIHEDILIKLYTNLDRYEKRLKEMNGNLTDFDYRQEIVSMLFATSL